MNLQKKITLVAGAALLATGVATYADTSKISHDEAITQNITTFNAIVRELYLNYVDSVNVQKVFDSAIGGLLYEFDPYTVYMDREEQESLHTATTGEYGGIGSYISAYDGWVHISGPYEDSPAAKAGLRSGDRLVKADTISLKGKTTAEVSSILRGQPGTKLNLEIMRPYVEDSILNVTIEREKLSLPSVKWHGVINDTTGIIVLESFMDKSPDEVRAVLEEFKANPKVRNIILDLRGNGGGLLESAVDILANFLPKGTEVLRTRGRDIANEKIYKTTRTPIMPDIPLAVLIDDDSASAAEITAGAIQDLDRGVLLGKRSFGKGLVQSTRSLPYDGLLKVTIAKYYIPSGRLIQSLDYSHRDANGQVIRTPDSLTNVYHTRAGREVRDGGGLNPDVEVSWSGNNRFLYKLMVDRWIDDFCTRYVATHPTVDSPETFVVTDEIFQDFKNGLDPAKLNYDKGFDAMFDSLTKVIEAEGDLTDEVSVQIDNLKQMLKHDLDYDLANNRESLNLLIGSELMNRYYYEGGRIRYLNKFDPAVKKAIEILNDPKEYKKILKP